MPRRRQQTASRRAVWTRVTACGEGVEAERTGWAQDVLGVRGRARGDSRAWNRRDPPRRPASGEGGAYKPKAKGRRAGRESEETIVPLKVAIRRPREGRGSDLVCPQRREARGHGRKVQTPHGKSAKAPARAVQGCQVQPESTLPRSVRPDPPG